MGVQLVITPDDLSYALRAITAKQRSCVQATNYYSGSQDLAFATDSFRNAFGYLFKEFAYNRCQVIVDAFDDRLQVTGWESDQDTKTESPIEKAANEIWRRNEMTDRQSDIHAEAIRTGSSYLIVWPDPATQLARYYPNDNHLVTTVCDDDYGDDPVFAVKTWKEERGPNVDRWRMTIYERDVITRWITPSKRAERPSKLSHFIPYTDDDEPESENPYGVVPVFQFRAGKLRGIDDHGELRDIIPLQDALNKTVADLMISAEFLGFPQRVLAGVEPTIDPLTGKAEKPFDIAKDRILMFSDPATKWGEFGAAALEQFTAVQDNFDLKIARVSQVPVHWLNQSGDFPSGEALKTSESPFVAKVTKWQPRFGGKHAQAMRFALRIDGIADVDNQAMGIQPIWATAESRSETEQLQNAAMKKSLGVPDEQLWAELGYSTDEIKAFTVAKAKAQQEQMDQFSQAFDKGNVPIGGN